MFPTKFRFIWPNGFREFFFRNRPIRKNELPVAAMFVNELGRNKEFYIGPSIDTQIILMCQSCYTDDAGNPYVSVMLQMIQVIPMCQ